MRPLVLLLLAAALAVGAASCGGDAEPSETNVKAVEGAGGSSDSAPKPKAPAETDRPDASERAYEAGLAACGLKRLGKAYRELSPAMRAVLARTYAERKSPDFDCIEAARGK